MSNVIRLGDRVRVNNGTRIYTVIRLEQRPERVVLRSPWEGWRAVVRFHDVRRVEDERA